jgi:hypothetical protein
MQRNKLSAYATIRSPNGKIILVRLMKGYKIWSKVNTHENAFCAILIRCLISIQEGQAKNLIPREREVSSVHWLPGGEGK